MAFRLRYQAHDLELPIGEFVIGRSTDCQLSLDDPLVSRRHAIIRVRKDGVSVQDLGSRNGVLVNGTKIDGEREVTGGDKISIGSQDMMLHLADEAAKLDTQVEESYRRATQTLGAAYVSDLRAAIDEPPTAEVSKSMQSFRLLGGVADKALAMGRAEEAERILTALLQDILQRVQGGGQVDANVLETAGRYAARLAGATTKSEWVSYVFALFGALRKPPPALVVDELYTVVRKVKNVDVARYRAYVAELRQAAATFGPAERFLVQRMEGLDRLLSSI